MNDEEKILDMLAQMSGRFDKIESDLAEIKETLAEHTDSLDALIEWTDNVQEVVRVPFAKPKAVK